MGHIEPDLLHFSKVVLGVSIQDELPYGYQGVIGVKPHLCVVEGVVGAFPRLLRRHDLDVEVPRGIVTCGDGVVKIPCVIVRVHPRNLLCLLGCQIRYT